MSYKRQPFFLRGAQENVNRWMDELGLPHNATRGEVNNIMGWNRPGGIDVLFAQAGLERDMDVVNGSQIADTMDSQRLSWHASTISDAMGESMWRSLSRRYFQGKDTVVRPLRLDSRALLLECAKEVGMDLDEAGRVLDSDMYRKDILDLVRKMHAAGVNSIPVLVFEVKGVACGSWLEDPRVSSRTGDMDSGRIAKFFGGVGGQGREIHHGSGNKVAFRELLLRLHDVSQNACL